MTPTPRLSRRGLLAAAAALPLAGCNATRLLDAGRPPNLYTLTPAREFSAGLPRVPWQLLVETPLSNTAINTTRIALGQDGNRITYFADANWIDTAPEMVQLLLVESLENSNRIVAVGIEASGLRSDFVLKTDLRDFAADYGAGAPGTGIPAAMVRINAKLVRMPRRTIVASDTFEAQVPAAGPNFAQVIQAFDTALETVLRRVVEWTLRQGAANTDLDPLATASR
ncbi:hypothetical protein HHL28_08685 [Aerophototrophica crusticola]|uniref:ABC-type transport auxiliary lipoprotein component domain-containing protein n=1 Tax=Aerophototrophica crusticola TaxID=1709002 RepID=A0A858R7B7_9PROT|nr:hypothetical protein HHL28_08685 [Rhodospirillaceae bacterium B3]